MLPAESHVHFASNAGCRRIEGIFLALQLCQRFHMLRLSSTECELAYNTICEISGYGDEPSGLSMIILDTT
jgi:hypothetical protein